MLALFVKIPTYPNTKDRQFFSGFEIFCGSLSATPLPTYPLVTPILDYCQPIGSEVLPTKDVNLKTSTVYHTFLYIWT